MNTIRKLFKHIWPFLIIFGLWLAFSFPYIAKGKIPFPSDYLVSFFPPWNASYGMPVKNNAMPDVITQIFPWKKLTIESWKQGEIPLWNPYAFSGTPHAANYQTAVFSPVNILFLFFPFVDAWSIMILLQPILAGVFMYIFLRELSLGKQSSTIGAIGFMFSGFMTTWLSYGTLGYAALPLPIIFYGILKFMKKLDFFSAFVMTLGTVFSFFSGHFQISIYVVLASMCFILYEAFIGKKYKRGIVALIFIGAGILLSTPQIALTFEAFQSSIRNLNTGVKEIIPWQYIVTFFSPDFYGNPVTRNDWFGHYAEWSGYIGVIPLLLAFYGIVFSKKLQRIFFVTIITIGIFLAYASPLSYLLFAAKVPFFSTSAASRIIVVVSFGLCVLASYGFDQMVKDQKLKQWKKICFFVFVYIICIAILYGSVFVFHTLSLDQIDIAKRNLILPTVLAIFGGILFLSGCLKYKFLSYAGSCFLIALVVFDMYRFSTKWMPVGDRSYVYPLTNTISFLKKTVSQERIFGSLGGEVGNYSSIQLIEGYDAMYQGRYGEFINTASKGLVSPGERSVVTFSKNGVYTPFILQLLGVRYIVHRISDGRNVWAFPYWQYPPDEMQSIYKDEHYEVFEYKKALPRVFLASSFLIKTGKQELIDTLFSSDIRDTVVVEKTPSIEPQKGEGESQIIYYHPNEVIIKTSSQVPKLLFLSDVYDKGWNVTVDGKKEEILRADYDFRAVVLDSGNHTVRFYYFPISLKFGIIFTVVGMLLFWGIVFLIKKKKIL